MSEDIYGPPGKCKACGDPTYDEACSEECFKKICTCTECPANKTCEYAFDDYNTNGDCIAEK